MPVEMQAIFDQVLAAARSRGVTDVEVIITTADHALTRFANNQIHQNVAERTSHLSVRPVIDGHTARASTNRLDRDGTDDVVEEAIAITRLMEPDPELLPLAEKADYEFPERFFTATSMVTPEERGRAVAEAIRVVEQKGQTAAGIYSTGDASFAIFNSRGVAVSHTETMAQFSITAMGGDSSGWAKESACSHDDLDPVLLAE
ncbi:MAG TPA: DNA gyrase modulator, partial [Bryobacteraceae bacterium]